MDHKIIYHTNAYKEPVFTPYSKRYKFVAVIRSLCNDQRSSLQDAFDIILSINDKRLTIKQF